jgi:hypothetical protein
VSHASSSRFFGLKKHYSLPLGGPGGYRFATFLICIGAAVQAKLIILESSIEGTESYLSLISTVKKYAKNELVH